MHYINMFFNSILYLLKIIWDCTEELYEERYHSHLVALADGQSTVARRL